MNKIFKYGMSGIAAIAVVAISMLASSCSNDEPAFSTESGSITFTTSTQIGDASSRVTYEQVAGKMKVRWNAGDVVELLKNDTQSTKLAEFTVDRLDDTYAYFKCTKVIDGADLTNVTGMFRYKPSGEGYIQTANGSVSGGSQGTAHLEFANTIESSVINNVNLTTTSPELKFNNTTAVFRVKFKPTKDMASGATIRMYGSSLWGGGVGTTLKLNFNANKGDIVTAYIPASKGTVTGVLGFIVVANDKKSILFDYARVVIGSYTIGREYTADLSNVTPYVNYDANGHGYVNLAGENWSTMNIGATDIVGEASYGYYFQWGATSKKTHPSSVYVKTDDLLSGQAYKLSTDEDAAKDAWGENWSMPTFDQCSKLAGCNWNWCTDLYCYVVYENADGPLLLIPAAGYKDNSGNLIGVGSIVDFWTSTGYTGDYAYCMTNDDANTAKTPTTDNNEKVSHTYRNYYLPIRPVYVGPTSSN